MDINDYLELVNYNVIFYGKTYDSGFTGHLDHDDLVDDNANNSETPSCQVNGHVVCGKEILSIEDKTKAKGNYILYIHNFSQKNIFNGNLKLNIYDKKSRKQYVYELTKNQINKREVVELVSLKIEQNGDLITNLKNLKLKEINDF